MALTPDQMTVAEIVSLIRSRTDAGKFAISFTESIELIKSYARCEASAAALDAANEAYNRTQAILDKALA